MSDNTIASATKEQVVKDSKITIHFSLTLADGTPVDGTPDGEPMTFSLGDGTMISAFEDLLLGMAVGERQQSSLEPRETFGFPDDTNHHWIEREKFEGFGDINEGLMVDFDTPGGDHLPGVILEIQDSQVLVDFNHPLAGHEVIFTAEVLEIHA